MPQHKRGPAPLPTERTGPNGFGEQERSPLRLKRNQAQGLVAHLSPTWTRVGYRYDVSFNDELIVKGSADPEFDAARALLAKGITGAVTIIDANTGRPRTIIKNIKKAADYCTKEGPLRFAKLSRPDRSPVGERAVAFSGIPLPSEGRAVR